MIPDAIERVALLGWTVYPQSRTSRAGCFEGAHDAATCDLETIERWSSLYPACNWRVIFGPSRLWGLDLDRPPLHLHDGVANFAALAARHDPIPPRPTLRSGGGGLAIFFRHDGEAIQGKGGVPVPGADPRRGRQGQTIPPSLHHATRQPYRWITPPWTLAPPAAPAWLLEAVKPPPLPDRPPPKLLTGDAKRTYAVAALRHEIARVARAQNGNRNNALNLGCWAVTRLDELTEAEIRDSMLAAAGVAAIPVREALATINSALRSRRRES